SALRGLLATRDRIEPPLPSRATTLTVYVVARSIDEMLDSFRRFLSGRVSAPPALASRHARRKDARDRHKAAREPMWTEADRHLGRPGRREVQDLTPDTPGASASRRTIDD